MRVVAFLCVILVHVITVTYPLLPEGPAATQLVLHSTRAVFFFVSTFVLCYGAYERPPRAGVFVARRLRLLGIPYLLWTIAYWVLGDWWRIRHDQAAALDDLHIALLWGASWYHMYFLLVSLQIGVLFPLFLRLLRAAKGHHGLLLAVSAVVQFGALALTFHPTPLTGWAGWYQLHGYMLLPTYGCFVVAGALAAVHLDRCHAWVVAHTRTIWIVVLGTLAGTLVWYRHTVAGGRDSASSSMATQPVSLLWGLAAVLALYAIATRWERARVAVPSRRVAALGAQLAFGVYLVHPMILRLLQTNGFTDALPWSTPADTAVLLFVVTAASALFAWLVGRTPLSPWLIGRERGRRTGRGSTPVRHSRAAAPGQHSGSKSFIEPVVSNHASGA
jgi:peptidoglycan/LPS O-acetylase OafA/YrhL